MSPARAAFSSMCMSLAHTWDANAPRARSDVCMARQLVPCSLGSMYTAQSVSR